MSQGFLKDTFFNTNPNREYAMRIARYLQKRLGKSINEEIYTEFLESTTLWSLKASMWKAVMKQLKGIESSDSSVSEEENEEDAKGENINSIK